MRAARTGIALALLIPLVLGPGTGSALAKGLPPSAVRDRVERIAASPKARVKVRISIHPIATGGFRPRAQRLYNRSRDLIIRLHCSQTLVGTRGLIFRTVAHQNVQVKKKGPRWPNPPALLAGKRGLIFRTVAH